VACWIWGGMLDLGGTLRAPAMGVVS